ncbi:autoinducer binding domain-containing protein [Tritonibacter mobilis]|nr:autoinducer binding domain-containing protein [Tritonibacter mobilis]
MSDIPKIMTQILEAPTLEQKYRVFADFMEGEFGYAGVNYGIFLDARSAQAISNHFIAKRMGMSSEWREIYQKQGYGRRDLAMMMGAVTKRPILQSQFYQMLRQDDIPKPYAEVIEGVHDFVNCGVVLPVYANGRKGVVGLYDPKGDAAKHDEKYRKYGTLIEALARHLHVSSSWAEETIAQTRLSEMNLRALRLKARGLRVKEILHQIERDNPKTVDNHMARVRRSLGARNDVEAVAKAATLGLLEPSGDPFDREDADILPRGIGRT